MQSPPLVEETLLKGFDPHVTRRLLGYFSPYLKKVILSLFLMLLNSMAAVAGPFLVKVAIDSGLEGGSREALQRSVLLYLLAIGIQWISIFLRVNIMVRVGQSIIYDLRAQLFDHLQRLSLTFYSRFSVGRVITRVVNDVTVLRDFITWALLAVARDLFTVIGIMFAMLWMNARLAMLTLLAVPVMIGFTMYFRTRARENYRKVRAAISWVNSVLAENINGARVVQAFSRESVNYSFFEGAVNRNNLETNLVAARIASAFPAVIDLLGAAAIAMVVWLGGWAAVDLAGGDTSFFPGITPGILVAFVLYIERLFDPIRDLSQRYDAFQSTMAGGERVFSLLDTKPEIEDAPEACDLPTLRGEIIFEQVSFHYADDPSLVLEQIDLAITAGETVALVGRTGAGKSTLVKLVSRFHDPTHGRVLIDGYDLRLITQQSLRSQMGIVLQDPFLFSGSVADNIRFGRLEASDEEIRAAAEAVGAHEFINRLKDGYQTSVEEGGVILSVGQRQLVSFARALLADPRILILDEATSSVDTQTEKTIQHALATLLKGRTALVIAHRLSTVINSDRIVVIEDGRIIEQGRHSELLKLGGVYTSLYRTGFNV